MCPQCKSQHDVMSVEDWDDVDHILSQMFPAGDDDDVYLPVSCDGDGDGDEECDKNNVKTRNLHTTEKRQH